MVHALYGGQLRLRLSRSAASSLGSKEPRIVAFEQYGRERKAPQGGGAKDQVQGVVNLHHGPAVATPGDYPSPPGGAAGTGVAAYGSALSTFGRQSSFEALSRSIGIEPSSGGGASWLP